MSVFEIRRKNIEKVMTFAQELRPNHPKRMGAHDLTDYQEAIIQRVMTELFVSRRTAYEYTETALNILKVSK
jgi:hypothetical protein